MTKKSPPLITLPLLKGVAGMLFVVLVVACSSPTKYPLRTPLKENVNNATSSAIEKPVSYRIESLEVSPSESVCGRAYRVKSGDSLSEIARQCQVSMRQLAEYNQILPPYTIYKNQRLTFPQDDSKPYQVAEILSEPVVKAVTKSSRRVIQPTANIAPSVKSHKKDVAHQAWVWPVHKSLPYRFIRDEAGLAVIEIYGVAGNEVHAVASGQVVYSGDGLINFGRMLVIKHDDNYMSVYAHNSALLVKEGDRVQVGQHIADLGATGNAQKPTLYLEARFQGRKVDIKKVLDAPKP